MLIDFVLLVRSRDDVGMAVADTDGDDAADAVEVAFAGFVPDVLHGALDEHEGRLVVEKDAGVYELFAQCEDFGGRGACVFAGLMSGGWKRGRFHWVVSFGGETLTKNVAEFG